MPKTSRLLRAALLLLLIVQGSLLAQEEPSWFPDVKAPLACSEAELVEFTALLRKELLAGRPVKECLKAAPLPQDKAPRVLFLTLGDGCFPARTYYAAGRGFRPTLALLLDILEKRRPEYIAAVQADLGAQVALAQKENRLLPRSVKEKLEHPDRWDSLRLDIVQATLPVERFQVNASRLLLSSVVGLAFDRTAAFAFPPEQLVGRCLMTEQRQLSVPRIGNLISEANLWSSLGLWQKMGAATTPFKVTLFETDSYFADRQGARRLFRARPARQVDQPREKTILETAQALAALLSPQDGTLKSPFPEWFAGRLDGTTSLADQATLVLTFLDAADLSRDTPRKQLLEAAKCAVQPILKATKHLDPHERLENGQLAGGERKKASQRLFALVVEGDRQEDTLEFEEPRRVSTLKTNALALLAFTRLAEALPPKDPVGLRCQGERTQLTRLISTQVNPDGRIVSALEYPTLRPLYELSDGEVVEMASGEAVEAAALAGLALQAQVPAEPAEEDKMLAQNLALLRDTLGEWAYTRPQEMPETPGLAIFLSQDLDANAPRRLAQLTRLALSAAGTPTLMPPLPDMFGCDPDFPSMTYAAERSHILALAVLALLQTNNSQEALPLLQDIWPLWVFQQQARMIPENASILPRPEEYLHFHRDNLADYGFTLRGQTTQLQSQMALLRVLRTLQKEALEPTPEQKEAWEKCWAQLEHRPLALAPELVLAGTPALENQRSLGGSLGVPTVETMQVKNANLSLRQGREEDEHIETKILERPKSKGKKKNQ
ncbi:MAG: hypothetical protein ACI4SG_03455 [Oligosphaeraceae bacterium]